MSMSPCRISIKRYTPALQPLWDRFVTQCKTPHFMFQRAYMDYHKERFTDHSLLFYNHKNQLIGLLPANQTANTLYSHQGLTFGGLLTHPTLRTQTFLNLFNALINYCTRHQLDRLIYKCIPTLYHLQPAEEDRYALFRHQARLIRRDVTSTIPLQSPFVYHAQRQRTLKKARKHALTCQLSTDYAAFWLLLTQMLAQTHQTRPTHTLTEITTLAQTFPDNIKLFVVTHHNTLLAGAVVYIVQNVVHTQYLANSPEGKQYYALDFLLNHLITQVYQDKTYFNFGISTEQNGHFLNEGLIQYKERFGAQPIVQDCYELSFNASRASV